MRTAATSPAVGANGSDRDRGLRDRRRRRARLTARATVLLTLVVGVLVLSIAPIEMYLDQRAELRRMERRSAQLRQENDGLSARAEQLRDKVYLERLARQCLGMVRPGETAFVVVPEEGAPAPPPEC
jgi:cell division protein FtsB